MSARIKELRAQRELIQKHLDWLDAQINQVEGTKVDSQTTETSQTTSIHEKSSVVDPPNSSNTHRALDVDAQMARYSSTVDIQNIRLGCFMFFAVATLLFLFLLFGLPYLLD